VNGAIIGIISGIIKLLMSFTAIIAVAEIFGQSIAGISIIVTVVLTTINIIIAAFGGAAGSALKEILTK